MSRKENESAIGPLAIAAVALDQELHRFRSLTEAGARIPLNSRRNIEKAGRALAEADASRNRIPLRMQELAEALQSVGTESVKCTAAMQSWADELEKRSNDVQALLKRFADLGAVATTLTAGVRKISEMHHAAQSEGQGEGQGTPVEVAGALAELDEKMVTIVEEARALARSAGDADFPELVGEVDSLRQQVLSAQNRVKLLRSKL